jgi:hypothetical protein
VQQSVVGKIRLVRMSVSVDASGEVLPEAFKWFLNPANFTHLLPAYGGQFHNVLFGGVGFPAKSTAMMRTQYPVATIRETGEQLPSAGADQVVVAGAVPSGGLFTVQLEGGQVYRTGLQNDIDGTHRNLRGTRTIKTTTCGP